MLLFITWQSHEESRSGPPRMGSNVSENKLLELFPHAAAIDVNPGNFTWHNSRGCLFFNFFFLFLKPILAPLLLSALVKLYHFQKCCGPAAMCVWGLLLFPPRRKLVENPAADISLPAMCHHINIAQLHQISRATNKRSSLSVAGDRGVSQGPFWHQHLCFHQKSFKRAAEKEHSTMSFLIFTILIPLCAPSPMRVECRTLKVFISIILKRQTKAVNVLKATLYH